MGEGYKGMLNIVYISVGNRPHTKYMLESIKRTMPNANIIRLSEDKKIKFMGLYILKRLAELDIPEMLLIGDDMIFQKSIEHLLDGNYDVLICSRPIQGDGASARMKRLQPYNCGLVLTKNKQFWTDCYNRALSYGEDWHIWLADQRAINEIILEGNYKVKVEDGRFYNMVAKETPNEMAYVLHFKGNRKLWMEKHATTN
jgi:hypothetical protein